MGTSIYRVCVAGFAAFLPIAAAFAQPIYNLQDLNSDASYDYGTQRGQFAWHINGTNHMFQQWFWYRAGADGFERSIDTIPFVGAQLTDTNPFTDPRPDTLSGLFREQRFDLETNFTLRGSADGTVASDITEQIRITNTTAAALPFTFFQYVDLDLNGTPQDTVAQILNGNTAQQSEGQIVASESVVTPQPSALEVNFFPVTLNSLNDGALTNLNNVAGPLGPGDLTWAFQWNFLISPGQSVIISKDKSIVPEPGALALLGLGGILAGRRRRTASA